MKPRNKSFGGFSIIELSIVMALTLILSGVLLMFYGQSKFALERGVQKTQLQQKVRLASIRIIPKIASTFRVPPDPDATDPVRRDIGLPPIVWPHPDFGEDATTEDRPNYNADPKLDIGEPKIRMNSTREFVLTQMRMEVTSADIFNPRQPRYAQLELEFVPTSTDPELGQRGNLLMRGLFDNNGDGVYETVTPDLEIARDLTNVSFLLYQDTRRVRVRVEVRGFLQNRLGNAQGERTVDREVYETDVFLPVYTNTAGGG